MTLVKSKSNSKYIMMGKAATRKSNHRKKKVAFADKDDIQIVQVLFHTDSEDEEDDCEEGRDDNDDKVVFCNDINRNIIKSDLWFTKKDFEFFRVRDYEMCEHLKFLKPTFVENIFGGESVRGLESSLIVDKNQFKLERLQNLLRLGSVASVVWSRYYNDIDMVFGSTRVVPVKVDPDGGCVGAIELVLEQNNNKESEESHQNQQEDDDEEQGYSRKANFNIVHEFSRGTKIAARRAMERAAMDKKYVDDHVHNAISQKQEQNDDEASTTSKRRRRISQLLSRTIVWKKQPSTTTRYWSSEWQTCTNLPEQAFLE